MRRGADQCLQWPEHREALFMVVQRALEKPALAREVERMRDGILDGLPVGRMESIVGSHPSMQRLLSKVGPGRAEPRHRADPRRDRHRQGADRARGAHATASAAAARS